MKKRKNTEGRKLPDKILDAINKIAEYPKSVRRRIRRALKTNQLYLNHYRLSDADIFGYVIPFLLENPNIEDLDIGVNNVTDRAILEISKIKSLRELNVEDAKIKDETFMILATSDNLSVIRCRGCLPSERIKKCMEEAYSVRDDNFIKVKEALLMGMNDKAGHGSPILTAFKGSYMFDKRLLSEIFSYIKPNEVIHRDRFEEIEYDPKWDISNIKIPLGVAL